jgi:hypothetical protein
MSKFKKRRKTKETPLREMQAIIIDSSMIRTQNHQIYPVALTIMLLAYCKLSAIHLRELTF